MRLRVREREVGSIRKSKERVTRRFHLSIRSRSLGVEEMKVGDGAYIAVRGF